MSGLSCEAARLRAVHTDDRETGLGGARAAPTEKRHVPAVRRPGRDRQILTERGQRTQIAPVEVHDPQIPQVSVGVRLRRLEEAAEEAERTQGRSARHLIVRRLADSRHEQPPAIGGEAQPEILALAPMRRGPASRSPGDRTSGSVEAPRASEAE